jgi:hypothetical protein
MAGGIGPPQDSERRALVRTSPKDLVGRSAENYSALRPPARMGGLGAASRVCDERPAARDALDPAPSPQRSRVAQIVLDNADDIIDGPRPLHCRSCPWCRIVAPGSKLRRPPLSDRYFFITVRWLPRRTDLTGPLRGGKAADRKGGGPHYLLSMTYGRVGARPEKSPRSERH